MTMNRIQASAPDLQLDLVQGVSTPGAVAEASVYVSSKGETPLSLFAPLHYEANYAYPLLIWLHGPGDDESQLKRIMPLISLRNYVGLAPRGTRREVSAGGRRGYGWSQDRAEVGLAEARVFEALELAEQRYHVAPRRIFLAGFDCGGTMAFRLAMSHPRRFAGVLSICGGFPNVRTPLARLNEARRIPVFIASGRDSQQYPAENVCENLKLLYAAGMQVALRQYPCGHQLTPLMLTDMDRWIMERITSAPGAC
jgi:phospholipase/carboxylesterase